MLLQRVELPSFQVQIAFFFKAKYYSCMLNCFSCVWVFATLWTSPPASSVHRILSRQEYRSGLPCRPPQDLPDPVIESMPLTSPAMAGGFFTTSATGEAYTHSSGFSVHGILQARILEWIAIPFSHIQNLISFIHSSVDGHLGCSIFLYLGYFE